MRRSLQLALFGIVLAGLISGTVAWASFSKTVTLTVDGAVTSVDTRAGDVQGVLADAGIDVAEHDTLAPPAQAAVADGGEIVLNRGRLLTLTIDGTERQIWVTARSVDEALTQLGYRDEDIYVSASRSTRLPLTGYALAVRMPKPVTVLVDGQSRAVTTTAPDVDTLLQEQGITLATTDRVSMFGDQPLLASMTVTVTRVRFEQVQETRAIAHKSVQREDDDLYEGESEVVTEGVDGAQLLTFRVTKTDGRETAREQVAAKVTKEPVDEVVAVGTRQRPAERASGGGSGGGGGGGGGGGATPPPSSTGLNWDALAQCESGGNWSINTGNGYYGGLQFDKGTWDAYGGGQYAAYPNQASRSQQIAVGENLYADRGDSPWPACGYHLYD